jgi:hypothetical protein
MIAVVVAQSIIGMQCPLTTLEDHWRLLGGQQGYPDPNAFLAYWAHELIFYNGPAWVFELCYSLFGAVVLATLILAPPRWPEGVRKKGIQGIHRRDAESAEEEKERERNKE